MRLRDADFISEIKINNRFRRCKGTLLVKPRRFGTGPNRIDSSANRDAIIFLKGRLEIDEPILFDSNVVIDESNDITSRFFDSRIARVGQTRTALENIVDRKRSRGSKLLNDSLGLIARIVVHDRQVPAQIQ